MPPKNNTVSVYIYVVSLGCDKNRVDTEHMLGILSDSNAVIVDEPEAADVIIVNTCGFINDAKRESIDTIFEMARYKAAGARALIVTGCLAQRYAKELCEEMPEVDAFLGVASYEKILDAISAALDGKRFVCCDRMDKDLTARVLTTPSHIAYVRISDGCSNNCSYCAIPKIRGGMRSRSMKSILSEIESLRKGGVEEAILIAQDTTRYGEDLGERALHKLIDEAADIMKGGWLRILYSYPEGITDSMIEAMLRHDSVCRYLDIPMQHFSDDVLKRMNRRNTSDSSKALVKRLHEAGFTLRTTLMVGFPGETDKDFDILLGSVKELRFERLGAFRYSPEEGTKSASMSGQISEEVKLARYEAVMELQEGISQQLCAAQVGKRQRIIIDGVDETTGVYIGRTQDQAYDIDGITYISSKKRLTAGTFHDVLIKDSLEYDLLGDIE